MPSQPLVSIIIPCRKERAWIQGCLESILQNDYPKERLELLVVDGMSEDGTRAVVEALAGRYPFVRLLDNPRQITPAALNIGIAHARGEVIMRADAHATYPTNYISSLVQALEETGADNVGGLWTIKPGGTTAVARAIAVGESHPFGVGNARYRIGASSPCWVDTVPFGCYRREVFDRIGTFDEQLIRNQDLELNLRLAKSGGRILLVPSVACDYHARDSLGKLWRMSYQNGYYNALVVRKLRGRLTLRHTIPPLFVAALFLTGILAPWCWWMAAAFAAIVAAYLFLVAFFSVRVALRRGLRCALALALVFPTLHVGNGLGTLKGVLDFLVLRKRVGPAGKSAPITR